MVRADLVVVRAVGVVGADHAAVGGQVVAHRVRLVPVGLDLVVAVGHRAGAVRGLRPCDQLGGGSREVRDAAADAFHHLVAERPHDDGRGVPVAVDGAGQIELGPGLVLVATQDGVVTGNGLAEPLAVILGVAVLRPVPHVEDLFDHEDALLVADVNQRLGCGVVRGADRVDAHLLENLDLALDGAAVGDRTERSLVMMH